MLKRTSACCMVMLAAGIALAAPEFGVGYSFHAFEHLNGYSEQAEAAAACGA